MSTTETNIPNNPQDNGEISINFGEIFRVLKAYKLFIAILALVFAGVGAVYSLTKANQYVSTVKLLPELDSKTSGGGLSGLKSLAGLAGIDLGGAGSSSEAIRPDLYPNIVQSAPFLQEVIKANIYNPKLKKWQSLVTYLTTKQDAAPITIPSIFSEEDSTKASKPKPGEVIPNNVIPSDVLKLNKKESQAIKSLKGAITVEIDKKSAIITLTVKMTNAFAAATISSLVQNQLTKYVINYRTEKARKELGFLQTRQAEARKKYDQALFTLSNYRDQNRNLFLNVAKDHEKKLQYEVDMAYNLYASLSTQMTDAQIKVQRETPIFKVLDPAEIAKTKVGPSRSLITLGFMFVGIFLALGYIFFKEVDLKSLLG